VLRWRKQERTRRASLSSSSIVVLIASLISQLPMSSTKLVPDQVLLLEQATLKVRTRPSPL